MSPNFYSQTTTATASLGSNQYVIIGDANAESLGGTKTEVKRGGKGKFSSNVAFKFIKGKFNVIGQRSYEGRINKLKKLSEKYLALGHNALGDKFLIKVAEEVANAELAGARIKYFLEEALIDKIKYRVEGGHIADTPFNKFTRVIPDKVLKRKKELDKMHIFEEYIIYHYYNEELEKKKEKKEIITPKEKDAMKDPILFGTRKEFPGRLFFIADWDDDYCDLTFDALVDALDLEEEDIKIPLLKRLFPDKKNTSL